VSNDSGYAITFDGDMWHKAGVRDYGAVPLQQAETIRLECFGDVIATLTYDDATRTYTVFGVWPMDENVIGDYDDKARGWPDWREAMRWIADLLSGGDRAAILKELEAY
jgi:hypothetical protein